MNENVPITVGIIGIVFLLYCMGSCMRVEEAKVEADAHEQSMAMIQKGYVRNGWGSWVKP